MSLKENFYIVSWSIEGIECCKDITSLRPDEWAKKTLFETIKQGEASGGKNPLSDIVNAILLRARFNPWRHYEVYVFTAAPSITLADIEEMYETNVQYFVNWVRKNHVRKMLDQRVPDRQVIY